MYRKEVAECKWKARDDMTEEEKATLRGIRHNLMNADYRINDAKVTENEAEIIIGLINQALEERDET